MRGKNKNEQGLQITETQMILKTQKQLLEVLEGWNKPTKKSEIVKLNSQMKVNKVKGTTQNYVKLNQKHKAQVQQNKPGNAIE